MYHVKKLVTYPENVWEDVTNYVSSKYGLFTPKHDFKFSKFIYSKSFNYQKFVNGITQAQALVLFNLVCKKVGIGFIPDDGGWKVISPSDVSDNLLNSVKYNGIILTEVTQVIPTSQEKSISKTKKTKKNETV